MTILVPFNKLVPSKANVRRVRTDIAPLAASLRSEGILQNLVVIALDNGRYEVVAGERRRQAAGALVRDGFWPKDQPIPCEPRDPADAVAISLAENVERVAMHPADAYRAFADLAAQGHDETAIAHRYGYDRQEVRKLLRLGALSPKALKALAADKIDVAFAQALTLTEDHALQEQVLKTAHSAYHARQMLTEAKVPATHRLFRFVAAEYAEAGGTTTADLFDTKSGGHADDGALVQRLVAEKLERLRTEAEAEGWGEAVAGQHEPAQVYSWHRLSPEGTREPTDDEAASIAGAQAAIAAREAEIGEGTTSPDDRVFLSEQRRLIADAATASRIYTDEQKGRGVLVITVGQNGEPVRTAYTKRLPSQRKEATTGNEPRERSLYDSRMIEDLSKVRTAALQIEVFRNQALAFDVLLDALLPIVTTTTGYVPPHALQLKRGDRLCDDTVFDVNAVEMPSPAGEVGDLLSAMPEKPDARFAWLRGLSGDDKARLLAFCSAALIDATVTKFSDKSRRASAERIAAAAGLDMAQHWEGGIEFYDRVTKRTCLVALEEACGKPAADNCAKLGKRDLAAACAERIPGRGWLPEPLRPAAVAEPEAEPLASEAEDEVDDAEEGAALLEAAE
jgi:ParB family transcriptional regulator, chromosome partitioning protein